MNYTKLVSKGYIKQYMDTMAPLETASVYDFICACWTISASIGRSVYIDRPGLPIYLNQYIILLAESGRTRKSTAISKAVTIQQSAGMLLENPVSAFKLERELYNVDNFSAHCNIVSSELIRLFGRSHRAIGLPGLLTDLYDCPTKRIGHSSKALNNVYITLLGGSTLSWLKCAITPEIIEGGFTSRTLFVHAEQPGTSNPWGTTQVDVEKLKQSLLDCLYLIKTTAPRITLTAGAMKVYTNWYINRKEGKTAYIRSFESREDEHILRLAAIMCIADKSCIIDTYHFNTAKMVIAHWKAETNKLLDAEAQKANQVIALERIKSKLGETGMQGVPRYKLYELVRRYISVEEFSTIIKHCVNTKEIKQFETQNDASGRRGHIYTL